MKQQQMNFDHLSLIAKVWRLVISTDDINDYERKLLIALLRAADSFLANGKEVKRLRGFSIFTIKRKELVNAARFDPRLRMSAATLDRCIEQLKTRGHRFVHIPDLEHRTERCSLPLKFAIDMEALIDATSLLDEEAPSRDKDVSEVDEDEAWATARRSSPPSPSSSPPSPSSSPPSPSSRSRYLDSGLSNSGTHTSLKLLGSRDLEASIKSLPEKTRLTRKLPQFEQDLDFDTAWAYLAKLRDGPQADDVADLVGLKADSEYFEFRYVAWCACVLRLRKTLKWNKKSKQNELVVKNAVGTFVGGLKGIVNGEQRKNWVQQPLDKDEDTASAQLKRLRGEKVTTAQVLQSVASSFSIDKSLMKGLPG